MLTSLTVLPFLALLKKELRRIMKVFGQTVITPVVNSSLYLLIFGVSIGNRLNVMETQVPFLAFLIPGLMMMGLVNNSFQNAASSISISKFHGELEGLKVTPLSVDQTIWAMTIASLLRGLIVAIVVTLTGEVFYYLNEGSFLAIKYPSIVIAFACIGGLTFGLLGVSVGFWAKNFEQLSALGTFVILPLLYLGGVFFSLDSLHPVWQSISKWNPMLYFINGIRYGVLGTADISWKHSLLVSVVSLIVLYIFTRLVVARGNYQRW